MSGFEMTPERRAEMVRALAAYVSWPYPSTNTTHANPFFASMDDLHSYVDRLTVEAYLQRIGVRF